MELPTPPQTVESSLSSQPAKRRRIQDSSTEGSDVSIVSGSSARTYTAEQYRVGVPALQLLPLSATEMSQPAPALNKFYEFLPEIESILQKSEIEYDDELVELVYRHIPDEEKSEDDLTVLILALWKDDDDGQKWLLAAQEIKTLLLSSFLTRRIKVELLSWQLIDPRTILPLEPEHPLVGAWTRVNSRVHTILGETARLQEGWKTIDVLRLGYIRDDNQQTPVTISITVDWNLNRRDWALAERQIEQVLYEENLGDVRVEFERGDVCPTAFPVKKPTRSLPIDSFDIHKKDYPQRVPMGADFGPERDFSEGLKDAPFDGPTATIGGYLEILQPDRTYQKYALTNYHCVREALEGFTYTVGRDGSVVRAGIPVGSDLSKIDKTGCGPRFERRQKMTFESPSRRKHNFTLQFYDEMIEELRGQLKKNLDHQVIHEEIADFQRRAAQQTQFFDDERHKYGQLWMCSGLKQRTKSNSRLDIALIEVKADRLGDNTVPDVSAWVQDGAPKLACGKLLDGLASCKEGVNLGRVFKVGSATGNTSGKFSAIKSDIRMEWDKRLGVKEYSTEYCFIGYGKATAFSSHGDSGSFVLERGGRWVGVVFGGCPKSRVREELSYVTDAQDILDWINEKSQDGNAARLATS